MAKVIVQKTADARNKRMEEWASEKLKVWKKGVGIRVRVRFLTTRHNTLPETRREQKHRLQTSSACSSSREKCEIV
jgi:hypothetical protein